MLVIAAGAPASREGQHSYKCLARARLSRGPPPYCVLFAVSSRESTSIWSSDFRPSTVRLTVEVAASLFLLQTNFRFNNVALHECPVSLANAGSPPEGAAGTVQEWLEGWTCPRQDPGLIRRYAGAPSRG